MVGARKECQSKGSDNNKPHPQLVLVARYGPLNHESTPSRRVRPAPDIGAGPTYVRPAPTSAYSRNGYNHKQFMQLILVGHTNTNGTRKVTMALEAVTVVGLLRLIRNTLQWLSSTAGPTHPQEGSSPILNKGISTYPHVGSTERNLSVWEGVPTT